MPVMQNSLIHVSICNPTLARALLNKVFQPHSSGAVYELRTSGAHSHLPVTGVHFRKVGAGSDAVQNNILLASCECGYSLAAYVCGLAYKVI